MGMVQNDSAKGSNTTSLTVTLGGNITAGNALVLTAICMGQDARTATLTPSGGGTGSWTLITDTVPDAVDGSPRVTTWVKPLSGGGVATAAVGSSASIGILGFLTEFSPISQVVTVGPAGGGIESHAVGVLPETGDATFYTSRGNEILYGIGVLGGFFGAIDNPTASETFLTRIEQNTGNRTDGAGTWRAAAAVLWGQTDDIEEYVETFSFTGTTGTGVSVFVAHGVALPLVGPAAELSATALFRGEAFAMLTAPHSSNIPASDFALAERWFYDDQDTSNYALLVARVAGANAHPPLRGADLPYAGVEGRQPLYGLHDGRMISFAFYVMPVDEDTGTLVEATEARQARANLDALQAIFMAGTREPRQLLHVMPDGSGRVTAAKVVGVQEMSEQDGPLAGVVFGLMVDLFLPDPWFHGLTISAGPTTISSSGDTATITHPGNVPSDQLILEFAGPFTGLRVLNRRNGAAFEYAPAVASGSRLHVNCHRREARVNGALVLGDFEHWSIPGDTSWMRIEPGENVLEITGSVVGGTLTTSFLPPYV